MGIKRCEATLEKIREFFEDKRYLPEFYNPYNNVEITDYNPYFDRKLRQDNK